MSYSSRNCDTTIWKNEVRGDSASWSRGILVASVATPGIDRLGIPALPAILFSFFAGLAAGAVTGVLHVKFNISKLLSGIIVMTALLSVTLALTKLLTRT